jgi:Animal haem peroxidase
MNKSLAKLCATDHRGSLWKGDHNIPPAWRTSLFPTHLLLAFLLFLLTAVTLAPSLASAVEAKSDKSDSKLNFMFGQLFPTLSPYVAPNDAALDALTAAGPTTAPGPLFDTNISAPIDPNDDNPNNVPSFFTYFGQFLDHDMTLDTLPLPTEFVDPNTIPNLRDPRLNLDSVYGKGPEGNPELYEADGKHFKVNGRDLPRNPSCVVPNLAVSTSTPCPAIIAEGRNDENQVIAQIHVAFLRAHNKLIDQGYKFEQARQLMKWRHQWIVVHEFLPEVLDPGVYADVFRSDGKIQTKYYDPKNAAKADMPVEFSVAAYRFGHSQVRRAYNITKGGGRVQVFNNTVGDLHGGRQIAADHEIFWPNFLIVDGQPTTGQPGTTQPVANISRKIDTLLSSGLFALPIPGAAPEGSAILAKRNIQRARGYGLPSGQDVAARLGITALSNADIAADNHIPRLRPFIADPTYQDKLPLWLYMLAESQIVHNGAKLGPVGSRIVAEVIGGLLDADNKSYYRKHWTPEGGVFRAQDLLREAGLL